MLAKRVEKRAPGAAFSPHARSSQSLVIHAHALSLYPRAKRA
jgi:hypothetical protein